MDAGLRKIRAPPQFAFRQQSEFSAAVPKAPGQGTITLLDVLEGKDSGRRQMCRSIANNEESFR